MEYLKKKQLKKVRSMSYNCRRPWPRLHNTKLKKLIYFLQISLGLKTKREKKRYNYNSFFSLSYSRYIVRQSSTIKTLLRVEHNTKL